MNYLKVTNGYLLRFDKDEKLVEELDGFVQSKKIKSGWVTGLGAAKGAEIGYYNLEKQEYEWQTIAKLTEITNLTGNISQINGSPSVHIHITLSDKQLNVVGGHLKELIVGGTLEVYLVNFALDIVRSFDEDTGLNTFSL